MSAPQILGTETYLDKTHAHPADQRLQRKPERHPFTHAGVSTHGPRAACGPRWL